MGVVDVGVRVSSHLKKELPWAVDKQLRVISIIMLLKNSKSTKEQRYILVRVLRSSRLTTMSLDDPISVESMECLNENA